MKPILFNTGMVRAILEGRKTVTRLVVKPQPAAVIRNVKAFRGDKGPVTLFDYPDGQVEQPTFPYLPGDILYVRETWRNQPLKWSREDGYSDFVLQYRADFTDEENDCYGRRGGVAPLRWRPSIHMPREAARIFLRVTDVRVERLWDMTDDEIARDFDFSRDALKIMTEKQKNVACMALWNSTIKKADRAIYGWDANPWVWAIEFERISRGEAQP